jgi:hypothetical protein
MPSKALWRHLADLLKARHFRQADVVIEDIVADFASPQTKPYRTRWRHSMMAAGRRHAHDKRWQLQSAIRLRFWNNDVMKLDAC